MTDNRADPRQEKAARQTGHFAYQSNASLAYTAALDELYGLGFLHYKEMAAPSWRKSPWTEVREVARTAIF